MRGQEQRKTIAHDRHAVDSAAVGGGGYGIVSGRRRWPWNNEVSQMNAEIFDTRDDEADLCFPAGIAKSIAVAIAGLVDLEPGDLFLEVGAGTGEIGVELSRIIPRYRGFDRSAARVERFRQRGGTSVRVGTSADVPVFELEPAAAIEGAIEIVQADAEEMWPAPSGGVRATFGSRVFHLLSTDHLVREVFRVSSPRGMTLMIGRVQRHPDSVRLRMRKEMRKLLAQEGIEGKSSTESTTRIIEQCMRQGAARIAACTAARWSIVRSPLQSIDSWRNTSGLAGIPVSVEVKQRVLARLRKWADAEFGDTTTPLSSDEEYIVEGVRLPARTL
jgi:SAM-dependent methyltransferase